MAFDDRVVWTEGMFIRPQHFQQEARYFEHLLRNRIAGLRGNAWGLTELRLNRGLLATGRFALERAVGAFEDGTPFALPDSADHPPPLELGQNLRDCVVYLALSVYQPGDDTVGGSEPGAATRYVASDFDVPDANLGQASTAAITVGRLRLRYVLETADRRGLLCIGLARIVEVRSDNSVVLDDNYIPPALDVRISPFVAGLLTELVGLLNHRGAAIAARLSAGDTGTAGDLTDLMMLQAINRAQPLCEHLAGAATVHAEDVYRFLVALAGELATFTTAGRRPQSFPTYKHDDLQLCYVPVAAALRQALNAVLDRGAMIIPMTEHRYGIRVAQVPDRSIFTRYNFFLAVKAGVPASLLTRSLPAQTKVGSVEQIHELINSALPGIPVRSLPVAPRQIPFHTGKAYFELDRNDGSWKHIAASSGLAIQVAGEFPGLELELWAIKD
ncbi:type VI secretion system baseplate subunit TssK [Methylobacterium sp. NEAU 140]|uniref:type VI secretion system baseplate subunit TssK n=1 Tax=Methylobacterium sp. NEAU 140 TaxID=3064945 RepID=UPI0027369E61|nr:type VI secretion system baseplate subunit TssK [Methylobacterium sp. NEAU 140]MDP4025135.1 type VI secretion system baseplate subunit TssK [Methylobacterium sp. NEAU 140]